MGLKLLFPFLLLLLLLLLLSSSSSSSSFVSPLSSVDHRRIRREGGSLGPQTTTTPNAQDLKRSYRLDSVKDDILRKLRMDAPPNVTGPDPSIPAVQAMLRQMVIMETNNGSSSSSVRPRSSPPEADLLSDEHDLVSPNTFILLSQKVPPEKRINIQNTCYFRFSPDLRAARVLTAQLGIYIRSWDSSVDPRSAPSPAHGRRSAATLILIFVISRSSSSSDPGRLEKTLYRRRKMYFSPTDMGKWYHFDVKSLAENWTRSESNNLGIQIYAQDSNGNLLAILPTSNETTNALRPYIEIQLSETRTQAEAEATRVRRRGPTAAAADGSHCDETGSQRRCCRYPLRIDFDSFGWDWVIAPKQYDAFYCSGDCPSLYYQQRDPHTHLYTQSNATGAASCCSPSVMSPLQILYVDSRSSLILGTLPSMIVERCGCS